MTDSFKLVSYDSSTGRAVINLSAGELVMNGSRCTTALTGVSLPSRALESGKALSFDIKLEFNLMLLSNSALSSSVTFSDSSASPILCKSSAITAIFSAFNGLGVFELGLSIFSGIGSESKLEILDLEFRVELMGLTAGTS